MNLQQVFDNLAELDQHECIFARKPWSPASTAVTARLAQNYEVPSTVSALGLEYFLEVHVAREVLEAFGGRRASKEEQLALLIFYAENDAYPDWVHRR